MGDRGPAKTPTKLRMLRGETRPSQINHNEPKPDGAPVMPVDMSQASKKVWRRIMKDYSGTGVLTGVDRDVLRAYCETVARYEYAAKALEESGPLVRGSRTGELVKNPLHQVVRDNALLVRALARELGFTPAARTGLSGADAGEASRANAAEGYFRGRRGA
ncbi:MAG: phage terminase small subunit P27 family [Solirubrobacteraceae bacterium]